MIIQGVILVLVLISMLGAKQPERTAMAVVLYLAIVSIVFDHAFLSGWISVYEIYPLVGIVELISALATIALSLGLRKRDRVFFFNMAKFLIASSCINFIAPLEVITNTTYQIAAYSVVIGHLAYMLRHSNGIMDLFRSIRDNLSRYNHFYPDHGKRESR